MTFYEKFMIDHPDRITESVRNIGCPHHYGYETKLDLCTLEASDCIDCWKREMPVEKKTVLEIHGEICDGIKELYKEKNKAYGNSFHNARKDVPCYTLGKLYDKFSRYKNLTKNPENAAFESIEDTLLDMANYCIMELAEMKNEKPDNNA